jgi:hypothetical protein
MNLIPWTTKKETGLTIKEPEQLELSTEVIDNDVVVRRSGLVEPRPKSLKIAGKVHKVDYQQLIRMVKQVTQTIGEYKDRDNPYASYVIGSLRKARADMVSDLESHFGINWEINEKTGKSVFYL